MQYKYNFKNYGFFQLKSWLGRKFLNTKPVLKNGINYLNLGSGPNVVDGYINADFFYKFKFWKKDLMKLQWQLDLRFPLDCADEIFDGIYSEHTLEHLYFDEACQLLKELHRVLKEGKEALISVWSKNHDRVKNKPKESLIPWTKNGKKYERYYYIYDNEELEKELLDAGFKIKKSWENENIWVVVEK